MSAQDTWYTEPGSGAPAPGDLVVAEGIWSPDWVRTWTGVLDRVLPGRASLKHWCAVSSTFTLYHAFRVRRPTEAELAAYQLNGGVPTEPTPVPGVHRGAT